MKRFIDAAAKRAFGDAIRSIESASAVEVVVCVRHHSGSYLHANLIAGGAAALLVSAFLLFSRFEFSLWSLWLEPFAAALAVGGLVQWLPGLRRLLTTSAGRGARVDGAARAAFFAKGVRRTRARTGVLVYLSLLEREVRLVVDDGVADAFPAQALAAAEQKIGAALRAAPGGTEVAAALAGLAPAFGARLPVGDDDENELADEVCAP